MSCNKLLFILAYVQWRFIVFAVSASTDSAGFRDIVDGVENMPYFTESHHVWQSSAKAATTPVAPAISLPRDSDARTEDNTNAASSLLIPKPSRRHHDGGIVAGGEHGGRAPTKHTARLADRKDFPKIAAGGGKKRGGGSKKGSRARGIETPRRIRTRTRHHRRRAKKEKLRHVREERRRQEAARSRQPKTNVKPPQKVAKGRDTDVNRKVEEGLLHLSNRIEAYHAATVTKLHAIEEYLKTLETKIEKQTEVITESIQVMPLPVSPVMLPPVRVTFLRRQDGSVNFTRPWSQYRVGFGDPEGEFWLGLEPLHALTSSRRYGLAVSMMAWNGDTFWARYSHFRVADVSDAYRLSVSGYDVTSTAGDSLSAGELGNLSHNSVPFSTYDRDHDLAEGYSCAQGYGGGWWYSNCFLANPTGDYHQGAPGEADAVPRSGVDWYTAYRRAYSFRKILLSLIPVED